MIGSSQMYIMAWIGDDGKNFTDKYTLRTHKFIQPNKSNYSIQLSFGSCHIKGSAHEGKNSGREEKEQITSGLTFISPTFPNAIKGTKKKISILSHARTQAKSILTSICKSKHVQFESIRSDVSVFSSSEWNTLPPLSRAWETVKCHRTSAFFICMMENRINICKTFKLQCEIHYGRLRFHSLLYSHGTHTQRCMPLVSSRAAPTTTTVHRKCIYVKAEGKMMFI